MKKTFINEILILCLAFLTSAVASASNDGWKIYASYHSVTKAVKMDGRIYALANGDLFSYDPEDTSVEVYDKTNCLSDFGLFDIAYCKATDELMLLYENGNIDIMDTKHECVNMSQYKSSSADKVINELSITGSEAFISTSSSVIVVNLKDYSFGNTYKFTVPVKSCVASDKAIYAKTDKGTYYGDRKLNLLNPNNWKILSASELSADTHYASIKNENKNDEAILSTVKALNIDSPVRNYSYKLNLVAERLLVAGGNFYYPETEYTGTAMKYEDGRWTAFDEKEPLALMGTVGYRNVTDIVQDPANSEHHWLGTKRSGIYEFKDYKLVNHYSCHNSPLTSIIPNDPNGKYYVRVTALNYDPNGNLWMCNNETDTIVKILKADGKWAGLYYKELAKKPTWDNTYFDQRGWAWINCRRTTSNQGASGMLVINTNGTIDSQKDDQYRFISTFSNQDGTSYSPDIWNCAVEDLDGAMWMGNTNGVFVIYDPSIVFNDGLYLSQVKVPRNDGSSLADYLMNGVPVKCIAIDGANRKWIGTESNGVFLVSADGIETIEHFTKENSPLISNTINSMAINGRTGEVFIATDAGLCSYMGSATDAEESMSSSTLKVFPNPVTPEYHGDVHISGLAFNSNVRIANAAGKLVYSGMSNGGQFTWNCCHSNGKRVSSGIYYALCTDEQGKKGVCAKILIIK